jgi:DNA-3-methyladenine glycosylase II
MSTKEVVPGTRGGDVSHQSLLRFFRKRDPLLAGIARAWGPCELGQAPRNRKTLFQSLSLAIISQQISGQAAKTIYGRYCRLFSHNRPSLTQLDRLSPPDLQAAGLSRQKAASIMDLATHLQTKSIPPLIRLSRLDDEQVIAALTQVKGIGRWTAEMFLIFQLRRPDVLPIDDFGVRKGFQHLLGHDTLPTKNELAARGELWRPWRSHASWYLWRLAENPALGQ